MRSVGGRSAWTLFSQRYLKTFAWSFLGLALLRLWLQYNLYNLHFTSDVGDFTIIVNMMRGIIILILLVLLTHVDLYKRAQEALDWTTLVAMTVSSTLIFLDSLFNIAAVEVIGSLLGAFGVTWISLMLICLFSRMDAGTAFLATFLSLAFGSLLCLLVGLIPRDATLILDILIPSIIFISYRQAIRSKTIRPAAPDSPAAAPSDTVYDTEPRSSFILLLISLGLFSIVMGVSQGFPHGSPVELSQGMQVVHQLLSMVLALILIWWTLVLRRRCAFRVVWALETLLVLVGLSLFLTEDPGFFPLGAMLDVTAGTMLLGITWYTCYDIGDHLSTRTYIVLGVAYAVYLLARDLGRVIVLYLGETTLPSIVMLLGMVVLLSLSLAIVLGGNIPQRRALLADFRETVGDTPVKTDAAAGSHAASSDTSAAIARLSERYNLTERESEIAEMLARGRSRTAIAEYLVISENTVRNYIVSLYQKVGVHSKQQFLDILETFERG